MSKSLLKSLSTVSGMTFVSRILGFVRDLVAAHIFGANAATDAFYIAFKIPNFMRNLFAEGAFSQAFVPTLSAYQKMNSEADVLQFISRMAGALSLALFFVMLIFIFFSPQLIDLFAPGLDPFRHTAASYMLKITAPYLMLISLAAFVGSVLNTYGKFAIPAFTPALLNVCLIATSFGITRYFAIPVEAQAWGVLLAGFVQFLFQLPALYHLGFLVRPRLNFSDQGVRKVLKLMVPALFGASVSQIGILLNTVLASFLVVGSVTWLYYSERLAYFPLGVFGVALSTIILPQLSKQHASASADGFAQSLHWGIRCNLLIGLPASITMVILSGPLVISLFHYGTLFDIHDVLMTQRSVIAYAVGLQAFMLVKLLSSAFYSRQDIRTPVKIAAFTLIFNVLLSLALIQPLAHAGLALATSLSSWINVIWLFCALRRRGIYQLPVGFGLFISRALFANVALGVFLWYASPAMTQWLSWNWKLRFGWIALLGLSTIVIYLFSLWLVRMKRRDIAE